MNRFSSLITITLLSLVVYGCAPATPVPSSTPETISSPNGVQLTQQAAEISPANTDAAPSKIPQTSPELVPTHQAPDPTTPTLESALQPTHSHISDTPQGDLFVVNPMGVLRLSLADGEQDYLLRKKSAWDDWRTSFSETGQLLAYWIRTGTTSELWLTHLKPWSPELIMAVSVTYDVVSLEWLANDRFLLLRLGRFEEREVGQNINVVWSSILDVEAKNIVSPENWLGSCPILAFSPQTNHLATWCQGMEESGTQQYVVVEENGEIWFTEQQPDEVLKEIKFDGETRWAWSDSRKYVAFTQFNEREQLYYTPTDMNSPTALTDSDSNLYSFISWSPNDQFLSYFGKCPNGHFCQVIIDVAVQDVLWHSQMNSLDNVGHLSWSPDSHYIAVSIPGEIVIINILSREEVLRLQDVPVIEMVWTSG